ncbi:MAG TPA: sigma 54-interacting transcriptional regulator [Kofleriaceae bacterium]|nr:sigma 54-interacting transcriptional regulator [Kofleriaceae bacterium]
MAGDEHPVTTAAVVRENALAIRRFVLTVVAGPNAGARVVSTGQRVVIGTHASAELALTDATVSRFHCELTMGDGAITVRDLGSKNGTRINGLSIVEAHLEGTATLLLGRTEVEIQLADSFAELPLSSRESYGELVGKSPAMRALYAQLERAAASDVTVLLLGETGTGKELAARAIHEHSARADAPFTIVDCGAIPHSLIDGELFGYERGAFSGAERSRPGVFELAAGGTVFLDEIGELPSELQPKLLRVLEEREVQRLGAPKPTSVEGRVIAATNRNLRADVNAARFRADLFYRLAVLEVNLPPLRERLDDIPLLVDSFLRANALVDSPDAAALRDPAWRADLARQGWRGNVRELRNHLERALLAPAEVVPGAGWEAPPEIDTNQKLAAVREQWVRYVERRYIVDLLQKHDGNVSAAARAAGVDRAHFYRIMAACGLR